jgi:hypothetical protein
VIVELKDLKMFSLDPIVDVKNQKYIKYTYLLENIGENFIVPLYEHFFNRNNLTGMISRILR